jgi:hypothetical protein
MMMKGMRREGKTCPFILEMGQLWVLSLMVSDGTKTLLSEHD